MISAASEVPRSAYLADPAPTPFVAPERHRKLRALRRNLRAGDPVPRYARFLR
jgi:hypothetical protein